MLQNVVPTADEHVHRGIADADQSRSVATTGRSTSSRARVLSLIFTLVLVGAAAVAGTFIIARRPGTDWIAPVAWQRQSVAPGVKANLRRDTAGSASSNAYSTESTLHTAPMRPRTPRPAIWRRVGPAAAAPEHCGQRHGLRRCYGRGSRSSVTALNHTCDLLPCRSPRSRARQRHVDHLPGPRPPAPTASIRPRPGSPPPC